MSATDAKPSPSLTLEELRSPEPSKPGLSDGRLAGLLLAFLLALYLLTSGGHGYSPDGEFAWRMGRSITMDPDHDYFKRQRNGLSQWGVTVPLLSQLLVVPGESLAPLLPQKDYVHLNGRTYILGIFRQNGLPKDSPTVGPRGQGVIDSYTRSDFKAGPATSLSIISFLALAKDIPQGTTVAEITLTDSEGNSLVAPIRAGVETAEWNRGKTGGDIQHSQAQVASIWGGNTSGRNFFTEIPFGRPLTLKSFTVRYLVPEGHLYVRAMALLDGQTGSLEQIPSEYRMWSERENDELFSRFFFSLYNSFVTAIGCILLFALARLLGYGQRVSAAATLVYGVSTVAWPYAKYDFSEPTLVMFVLATLYLILRWGQNQRDGLLLLAGTMSLLSMATKYASGIIVPFMLLQIVLLHRERHPSLVAIPRLVKSVALFCLPFLVVAVPAVLYMSRSFGYWPSILEAWAGVQRGWLPLPIEIGLAGLLLSPGKSFFLYSPPTVLALFSVVAFVRRHGIRTVAILAIILAYFLIYSKKPAWHAGAGWGPRYQVLVLPLFVLVAAPLIEKAIESRRSWARYALLATFLLGLSLQMLAVTKSFDYYLGIFRHQVVTQLPDRGAQYGGAEYYPYAEGLDDSNSITATMLAWPFSPILANGWLISADFLSLGPSFLQPTRDKLLSSPPWKLFWGIDAVPVHPEYGLGFDFWSMRFWTDFPSFQSFRAGIFLVLLLLETTVILAGIRLLSFIFAESKRRPAVVRIWVALSTIILLLFNGIHFLL